MRLLAEISPVDGPLHVQNLLLLNYLASCTNADTFNVYAQGLLETGDATTVLQPSGSLTKTVIVQNDTIGQLVILLGGMNSFSQAPLCLQSWADTAPAGQAFNTYLNAALTVNQNVSFIPAGGYQRIRIIGHSYGGAVAMHLPQLLQPITATNALLEMYTYGAPKPYPRQQDQGNTRYALRRCFQNTDPVPSLPLSSSEVGSLYSYVGVSTARNWERWIQRQTGLVFDGLNHMVQSNNPTISATPTVFYVSLARWISGSDCFGADVHSLASYTQIAATVVAADRPGIVPQTESIRARPVAAAGEVSRLRDQGIAVVAVNVNANMGDVAAGIVSGIPIVPGVRYAGGYLGREPYVFYGNTPVVPTKTLRTRRALVRYLNGTLNP